MDINAYGFIFLALRQFQCLLKIRHFTLSCKFSTSFLHPNPTGHMRQLYLEHAILQAVPVLISKQSISPSAEQCRDSQRAFCMCVAVFCSHLCSVRIEVSMENSCSLIALPTLRSRTSCFTSTEVFPKFFPKQGLCAPIIAHFFPFLCAFSHDGCCQDLCPCSVGDASCFRLLGIDIYCPWLTQKRQRNISSPIKNLLPPLCELHCFFLLFSHPLHSWQGTILNTPLSLLPWPG